MIWHESYTSLLRLPAVGNIQQRRPRRGGPDSRPQGPPELLGYVAGIPRPESRSTTAGKVGLTECSELAVSTMQVQEFAQNGVTVQDTVVEPAEMFEMRHEHARTMVAQMRDCSTVKWLEQSQQSERSHSNIPENTQSPITQAQGNGRGNLFSYCE